MKIETRIAQKNSVSAHSAHQITTEEKQEITEKPPSGGDQHLATDHLLSNLKNRTISSGFVTLASQGAVFALNLGSAVVLARLLTPQDFGLVVMVTTVLSFFRIFKEAGLSTATVQREGITHAQVSNLFWINVSVSGFFMLIISLLAPAIAWFYREPRITGVTIILSATLLISGMTAQHQALLNRQMRFKTIALVQVTSMFAGVAVGIGMAWFKFGHWALVGMQLTTPLLAFLLTWRAMPWRPQKPRLGIGTRPLLNFGANLAAGEFIWSLARGTDGLLVGRFCGVDSLGLYSRAVVLLVRPMEFFTAAIASVFMPTLSRLQTNPERYRRAFLELYEAVALVSAIGSSLIVVLAHPLTLLVLGRKWEASAPIFSAIAAGAYCLILTTVSTWLLSTQGRGKESMFSLAIASVFTVASFIVGLPFGPLGVAIAFSATSLLCHPPILFYIAGKRGPVSVRDLFAGLLRHLPLWGVVFAATYLARSLVLSTSPLNQVLFCGSLGILAGVSYILISPRSREIALNLVAIRGGFKAR